MKLLGINSRYTSKLKPLLADLMPLAWISPSLVWIALDKSVWTWDPALYGKGSVELFYTLISSPKDWVLLMLNVLHSQAPGVSWFGQLFVPVGYFLRAMDVGLLLSIWVTQALTLALMYQSARELSDQNRLVAVTVSLIIASAPLFVGMTHQYFAEPLQLFAVSWFVMIMSFAPKWNRAFILSQLLVATPVAMLAKVSSPLYCVGPGLVALWYAFKRRPSSSLKQEWLQTRVLVSLSLGMLVSLAALAWYYRNTAFVIQHVSIASSGPIAELYGKKELFFNALLFWLGAVQNAFFLPLVLLMSGLLFLLGFVRYFLNARTRIEHFAICSAIAFLQILVVLATFSLNSNRDSRYLLPILPYVAFMIGWSVAQINRPILAGLAVLIFSVQLATSYGQALGVIPPIPAISGWLLPLNSNQTEAAVLSSIVSRTCIKRASQTFWNIIGIEKPWLNQNSAGYFAAKNLAPYNRVGCQYGSVHNFFESDPDKVWNNILSAQIHYYITISPDSHPVPEDSYNQAINRNYLAMLHKVQRSGLFELEPPLAEDPDILIFRRTEMNRINYTEASSVAEHGVQSVHGARFGENIELVGAVLTPALGGMELQLAWRCVHEVRLEYMVAVHLLDETRKILAQLDFAQDIKQARVTPGAVWMDRVSMPAAKLKGVQQVGIALYIPGGGMEPIDRGPRDWDEHRLLLPLEKAGTKEASMRRE